MAKITNAVRLGASFKIADNEQTPAPKMRFIHGKIIEGLEYHDHSATWQSGTGNAPAINLSTSLDSNKLPLANLPDHTHVSDSGNTGGKLEVDDNLTFFLSGNIVVKAAVIDGIIPFRNGATLKNIFIHVANYNSGTTKIDVKRAGVSLTGGSGFQITESYYSNTPNASVWTSADTLTIDIAQAPSGGQGANATIIVQGSQVVG